MPRTNRLPGVVALSLVAGVLRLLGQQPTEADLSRMVKLEGLEVKGTRFSSASLSAISGLRIGAEVNDTIVRQGCDRIQKTGLVKSVDYLYNLYPDRPAVTLTLTVVDEGPLLPAVIHPESEDAELWGDLQKVDPIFTRTLPPTERALKFYALNLERCLKKKGRDNEYFAPSVIGDKDSAPTGIVFTIKTYKNTPKAKPQGN